ncbi:GAF domain-containing protein [Mesorhizobium atlanticum]
MGKDALSYLGVPIKTAQGNVGVISVQSTTREGMFDDAALRLLTTIAATAGAALHNAQLFSDLKHHRSRRSAERGPIPPTFRVSSNTTLGRGLVRPQSDRRWLGKSGDQ